MPNRPCTDEENVTNAAVTYGLAQFIAWQDTLAEYVVAGKIPEAVGRSFAHNAGKSVTQLMIGNELHSNNNPVSLSNEVGQMMAQFVEKDLDNIIHALEAKITNMEAPNVAAN